MDLSSCRTALTIDLDWAPDWAINELIDMCYQARVPATLFVTHESEILDSLQEDSFFELGIHPNFLPGSSHGSTIEEVLSYCLRLAPKATSMRSHALVQSSHIFSIVADSFPQIHTDVSLLLPLHSGLQATDLFLGESQRRITRLPYFWEDDTLAAFPNWDWNDAIPQGAGLRIFDFHPTFVYLNLADINAYIQFKASVGDRPFQNLCREDFEPFINSGKGCKTALQSLLKSTPPDEFRLISELTQEHLEKLS